MKSQESKRCPLCEGHDFVSYRFSLLRCGGCGFVLSPAIWDQYANEHVNEEWFGVGYEQRKSSAWVNWFEARNNRRTLRRLKRLPPTGISLLEVGVGSGSFLASAQQDGFEVMGCDLSASICERAKRVHNVSMHCGTLETLLGDSRFDIVVMNHVLEHVQDPVTFLRDVHRLLVPGGFVHIAVPNIACFEAALSGWTSYEPYHLIYFDKATLQRALKAAHLQADSLASHESFSGWFLTLLRTGLGVNREEGTIVRQKQMAATDTGSGKRSSLVEHGYRVAMTLAGGLWPLRRLQGALGRGDELLCIARKPAIVRED